MIFSIIVSGLGSIAIVLHLKLAIPFSMGPGLDICSLPTLSESCHISDAQSQLRRPSSKSWPGVIEGLKALGGNFIPVAFMCCAASRAFVVALLAHLV